MEAKIVSRGIGRSAVAAVAYMTCSRIYNDYDGITHDYRRKHGLVYENVYLPSHAPPEWKDRSVLWNAVEEAEKTKDSRLAREIIVALPIELTLDENIALLENYVQSQFVSDGICADVGIHDTDGHNPHAHIMLTVRPLKSDGTWQAKTEKEYLCKRGGEEKGFTASEFLSAQKDGWEKQYLYLVNGKKKYLLSSEAVGYERLNKHPKSSKYGRQNPITEKWNSDEQLFRWRQAWADTVNRHLERNGFTATIDHRSFKARGITEQPTVHLGVAAIALERKGKPSDRRKMNVLIRIDNEALRYWVHAVEYLLKSIGVLLSMLVEKLEDLHADIVMLCYEQRVNRSSIYETREKIKEQNNYSARYKSADGTLTQKKAKRDELQKELNALPKLFNKAKRIALESEIRTLNEEISDLSSRTSMLKQYAAEYSVPALETRLDEYKAWGEELDRQMTEKLTAYRDAQTEADSADKNELEKARQDIRPTKEYAAVKKLSETYGFCERDRFDRSRTEAAELLGENLPDPFKALKVPGDSAKEKRSKNNQERQL